MKEDVFDRLKEFMENEARSCSMDFGCINARVRLPNVGEKFSIEEIDNEFHELQSRDF